MTASSPRSRGSQRKSSSLAIAGAERRPSFWRASWSGRYPRAAHHPGGQYCETGPGRLSPFPRTLNMRSIFISPAGLLHGRAEILADDPERTNIIGNFHMTYKDHPINCDQFPWFARVFTKPHIEIENDPRVWAEAASLIDVELSGARSIAQAPISLSATSLVAKSPICRALSDNARMASCKNHGQRR